MPTPGVWVVFSVSVLCGGSLRAPLIDGPPPQRWTHLPHTNMDCPSSAGLIAAAPPSSSGLRSACSMRAQGGDITNVSAAACAARCDSLADCVGFVTDNPQSPYPQNICFLRQRAGHSCESIVSVDPLHDLWYKPAACGGPLTPPSPRPAPPIPPPRPGPLTPALPNTSRPYTSDFLMTGSVTPVASNATVRVVVATSAGRTLWWEWATGQGEAVTVTLWRSERNTSAGNNAMPLQLKTTGVSRRFAPPGAPYNVSLLRRGSFFFLYLGSNPDFAGPDVWIEHPTFDLNCPHSTVAGDEPIAGAAGIAASSVAAFALRSFQFDVAPIRTSPVLHHCGPGIDPNGTRGWCYNQVIPGALLVLNGTFYVYVAGQDYDGTDGGGRARIGVAHGPDLDHLTLEPEFLLEGSPGMWDERSVFPNGAVVAPNGSIALTYMGQDNSDAWGGIGLAFSPSPLGPFTRHGAPVLRTRPGEDPIHEHTLNRLPNGTYLLFYTGNNGSTGDQGFLATSADLVQWTRYGGNPALPAASGLERGGWDSGHRRPRSLFQHQGWWYLLYEGTQEDPRTQCWGDTIGLMRARRVEGPWEDRHPLQVSVPPRVGASFDSTWTGWPRAYLDEAAGLLQVLYSAGGDDFKTIPLHPFATTGLRTWSLQKMAAWSVV